MDDYAGRVLADRYRLPLPSSDEYEPVETRAFDTYSGQDVLVRQVPLPEVVDAEVQGADGRYGDGRYGAGAARRPANPALRRAIEAAQAAAQIPDHPRLDQVFDVFAEGGSLWIVSEFVMARPLAALLAEQPMAPYRAAEVASDVLTALRVLHAHGWTHRNITERTVLICDDGRVMLTGLAVGAAEEALCGYVVVPPPLGEQSDDFGVPGASSDSAGAAWGDGRDSRDDGGDPDDADAPHRPYLAGTPDAPNPPYSAGADYSPSSATGPDDGGPDTSGEPDPYSDTRGDAYGDPYSDTHGDPHRDAYDDPYSDTHGDPHSDLYGDPYDDQAPEAPRPPHPASLPSTRAPALPAGWSPAGSGGDEGGGSQDGRPGPEDGPAARSGGASGSGRAGAVAAYRAGTRATARVGDDGAALPVPRSELTQPELTRAELNQPELTQPELTRAELNQHELTQAELSRAESAGSWHDLADQGVYDPVSGTRVPRTPAAGASSAASPYAVEEGPDSGRTRRAYDPVTGRWVPRPAQSGTADAPPETAGRPTPRDPAHPAGPHTGTPHPQLPRLEVPHAQTGEPQRPDRTPAPRTGARARPPATTGPRPSTGPRPALPHAVGAGAEALRADAQRQTHVTAPVPAREGGWEAAVPQRHGAGYRGPATRLDGERARQTRIALVGAVTERWAPEQAGPVHENWRLAPPIGPATDLWALGALLFRAVQGHAPYPEESAVELVQMVCGEPPAFAEECGPLRPVVESLLRQDPTERPDFEELRGWLRSIVRSAPEPDAGTQVVPLPPADATRLPIVRRRGELVRRRRGAFGEHGRHRQQRCAQPRRAERRPAAEVLEEPRRPRSRPPKSSPAAPRTRGPRSLGRILVLLILLFLAAALAYAVFFMPESGAKGEKDNTGAPPAGTGTSAPPSTPAPSDPPRSGTPSTPRTQTTEPGARPPAKGYVLRTDPEGFRTAVDPSFQRRPINDAGQVRYVGGDFTLLVVPGRDAVKDAGADPLAYQRDKERELQPFRDSAWATATGLRRVDIGQKVTAEGQFTWRDSTGRTVYVRNQVMIINGRYHLVVVIGPEPHRDKVSEIYTQATAAYSATR
ncbi:protein kinase [Streptomyces sp. NPDC051597]|uniref:protein kinase n=1 Tax=Streptomyces sp. NPDC051597 TaxID=3155049 RepID=UPI003419F1D9